jgi:hypothetical protein
MRTAVMLHCTVLVVDAYTVLSFGIVPQLQGMAKNRCPQQLHTQRVACFAAAACCLLKLLQSMMQFISLLMVMAPLLLRRAAAFIHGGQVGCPLLALNYSTEPSLMTFAIAILSITSDLLAIDQQSLIACWDLVLVLCFLKMWHLV